MGLIVIVWCGISLYQYTGRWFTLVYMFEVSFYIFTLGQSLLCGLGVENGKYNQYAREAVVDVNTAYVFTILCLITLHIGILWYINRKNNKLEYLKKETNLELRKYESKYSGIMKSVGWVFFAISIVPYIFESYKLLRAYSISGYAAAFSSISGTTSWSKAFSLIADFFPFILFMLYIVYIEDRVVKKCLALLIFLVTIYNLAIGNRCEPICYRMAYLWLNNKMALSKSQERRTTIIAICAVLFLMLIIPVIGATRNTGELSVNTVLSSLVGEDSFISTIFETISNLGYSVFPTIKTMQIVPNTEGYHWGQSYLYALLSVFPNVFGGTHISVKYAALAQWLMKTLGMTYGPGYSMPAEAYYNFGWAGILAMPIIGCIISKLLYENDKNLTDLKLFSIVGAFIVLFSIPRRDTLTAVRELAYYVGLLYLIVYLLKRWKGKDSI